MEPLEHRCLPTSSLSATLVADINPGVSPYGPVELTNVNGTLFFQSSGLRKSDGTAAGTVLVKDIAGYSLTNVNETLFFVGHGGSSGYELWKSDGTAAGTVLVKDIFPGTHQECRPPAYSGEPICFDVPNTSEPALLTNVNGTLFFTANDGKNGRELWKSDGTKGGTVLVKDIVQGTGGSGVDQLTNVNGTLFFRAGDGQNGYELWKSSGTKSGTMLVKDINMGSGSSSPWALTNVAGMLFFSANDGSNGFELWKSNGTSAGTVLVKDIVAGSESSRPELVTDMNGLLFFVADNGTSGKELWRSDGTAAGTVLVKDINPGTATSSARNLRNVNGTLYFAADDGSSGHELWRSDGTAAGTVLVKDINALSGGSDPSHLTKVNGLLYFAAADGTNGRELWQSDGTAVGTILVRDIYPGSGSSDPSHLVSMNNKLYFAATDPEHGRELWDPPAVLSPLVQVSSSSPFADCPVSDLGIPTTHDAETEPYLAVDPTNPNHTVGAWIQDAAKGIVAAVTFNGGSSWRSVVIPGMTICSGGIYPRASDPWLSFAPNGDVYLSVHTHDIPEFGNPNAILVSKSTDGGLTWSDPTTIVTGKSDLHDNASITADPTNSQFAYVTWGRFSGANGTTMFSRTTDGGQTWEPARKIFDSGSNNKDVGHQILALPDGTLVNLFTQMVNTGDSGGSAHFDLNLSIIRSSDQGRTWRPDKRKPIRVAQMLPLSDTFLELGRVPNPDEGAPITAPIIFPDFAVDPANGNLYAVWQDARFSNFQHYSITFAMSSDGGFTWSKPIRINQTPDNIPVGNRQAFLPSVAVAADGTVAVTYYDFRNNTSAPALWTDYWMVHAHPGDGLTNPGSWSSENRLTRDSFDMQQASLLPDGYFVGDYQGLVATGNSFGAFFAMPHDADHDSIFFRDPLPAEDPPVPMSTLHDIEYRVLLKRRRPMRADATKLFEGRNHNSDSTDNLIWRSSPCPRCWPIHPRVGNPRPAR